MVFSYKKNIKGDPHKDLIKQVEEDRKQRLEKRVEYGRKNSGLIPVQKTQRNPIKNPIVPERNLQSKKKDDQMELQSIIEIYQKKLKKINNMKKENEAKLKQALTIQAMGKKSILKKAESKKNLRNDNTCQISIKNLLEDFV